MIFETADHILGTFDPPDEGALERERRQFRDLYRHFARDLSVRRAVDSTQRVCDGASDSRTGDLCP